jgi:hypothetical protein
MRSTRSTRSAQHSEGSAGRHQRDGRDTQVEHAPGVAEESASMRHDAQHDLDHEHRQDGLVQRQQRRAPRPHRRRRGFQPEDDGVDDDQREDAVVYKRVGKPALQPGGRW